MSFSVSLEVSGIDELNSALKCFDDGMKRWVREQLKNWCNRVKEAARQRAPVRTGHLRNSVYVKVGDWTSEVGAGADYAVFVEFGTRSMRASPFLFPAVQEQLPSLESMIYEALELAGREAGI